MTVWLSVFFLLENHYSHIKHIKKPTWLSAFRAVGNQLHHAIVTQTLKLARPSVPLTIGDDTNHLEY